MRLLLLFLIMFLLAGCDEESSAPCKAPTDCIKIEECRFDTLDIPEGVCVARETCRRDSDCNDGRYCTPDETNFYCGSRKQISLSTALLEDALQHTPYSYQFELLDGSAVHSFVISDGKLPEGITLSLDGLLSGTSSDKPGYYSFKVKVIHAPTDATYYYNYRTYETGFSLNLKEKPLP